MSTVPTDLERSTGYSNLSELLTQGGSLTDNLGRSFGLGQVFDPATTRPVTAGTVDPVTGITAVSTGFVREPFANNMLPANRLDQNAINLLNLFPTPNNSGLFNNFVSNPVLNNNTDQFDVRVDQNFSSKDSVFGRVSYVDNPEFIPGPFGGIADGGSFSAGNQLVKSVNSALSETHTFTSQMVNEARVGYNHLSSSRVQPNADTKDIPAQFGIQGVPQASSNGGLGSIFFSGLNTLGSNQFLPSIELSTTSQFTDNLTRTAGRQTLKFGFQWERLGFSILQPPSGRGTWSFSGVYTEIPTTTGGNTGLAQMLLSPIPGTVTGAADFVGGADDVTFSNFARTSRS